MSKDAIAASLESVSRSLAFALMSALLVVAACSDTDDSDGNGGPGDSGADRGGDAAVDVPGDFGGGDIAEFAGLWQLDSITLTEAGSDTTLTREGEPASLRGDVRVGANGELRVRVIGLLNGLLLGPVEVDVFPASVIGDIWRITTGPGQTSVFGGSLAGETLTLVRDPDHPDDTGDADGPSRIVVSRLDEPVGDVIGVWDLVSADIPGGGTVTPDCTPNDGDDTYSIFDIGFTVDADYIVSLQTTNATYSDADCTVQIDDDSGTQPGTAEERGSTLSLWLFDEGGSNSFEYAIERDGDQLALTRQSCRPAPSCESETPSAVNFELAE